MNKLFVAAVCIFLLPMTSWSQPVPAEAVFLLDASISNADAFAGRVEQLVKKLETDATIKKFNVLVFDVSGRWLDSKGSIANDADSRKLVRKQLAEVTPEGACDLAAALDRLGAALLELEKGKAVRVFLLSEGNILLGETDPARLVAACQEKCPHPLQFQCLASQAGKGNADLCKALEASFAKEAKAGTPRRDDFERYVDEVSKRVKFLEGKHGEHVRLLIKSLSDKDLALPSPAKDDAMPRAAGKAYLDARAAKLLDVDAYLNEAKRRGDAGDASGQIRVLTSLLALYPIDDMVQRSVGYRLFDAKQPAYAVRLFERIQRQRSDDPHAYRDLARAYEDAGLQGLAALQYEIVLAGNWDNKYAGSFKEVAQEEYAHMMRDAIRRKAVSNKLIDVFGERLEGFDSKKLQADLRVTMSWNTDNTDVDLWVIEPGGEKCFYGHQKTNNGGELTQDIVNGYGPERYQMIKAVPGEYQIIVHFYSGPRNPQVVEGTHVNVVIRRNAGTPQEESQRHTVILRRQNDQVEVARMKF